MKRKRDDDDKKSRFRRFLKKNSCCEKENSVESEGVWKEEEKMDVLEQAKIDRLEALRIVEKSGVVAAWESIGAQVSLVGSLRMGLLVASRRDVDFHIYSAKMDVGESFLAVGRLARNPGVRRVEFINFLATEERCFQWRVWFAEPGASEDAAEWAIDMVHIEKNSRYDGYFEDVADRIAAALTPETKRVILELKAIAPESDHVFGVEFYRAVLEGGVRDWNAFVAWRRAHPLKGVLEWKP